MLRSNKDHWAKRWHTVLISLIVVGLVISVILVVLGGIPLLILTGSLWAWGISMFVIANQLVALMLEPVERVLEERLKLAECEGDEIMKRKVEKHLRKVRIVRSSWLFPMWWEYKAYISAHSELDFARGWFRRGARLWFAVIVLMYAVGVFVGYMIYYGHLSG